MTTIASQAAITAPVSMAGRWPAVLALFLGAIFVFGTGFAHVSAVHNAALTRGTPRFPCH